MELRTLKYFTAVAESLSFSVAAEKLGLSQSAVSRQIQLLERELGVRLFDRVGRKVRMTPAGRELMEPSYQVQNVVASLTLRAREMSTGSLGMIRVGATPQTLESLLAPLLPRFQQQHPEARYRCRGLCAGQRAERQVPDAVPSGSAGGAPTKPPLPIPQEPRGESTRERAPASPEKGLHDTHTVRWRVPNRAYRPSGPYRKREPAVPSHPGSRGSGHRSGPVDAPVGSRTSARRSAYTERSAARPVDASAMGSASLCIPARAAIHRRAGRLHANRLSGEELSNESDVSQPRRAVRKARQVDGVGHDLASRPVRERERRTCRP